MDDKPFLVPGASPYPTGSLSLAGLLIGALMGAALGEMPVGMAAGLAVGVGIDSLLNHWINGVSTERDARKLTGSREV